MSDIGLKIHLKKSFKWKITQNRWRKVQIDGTSIVPTCLIPLFSLSPKARSSITQSNILIIQPGTNRLLVHYPFLSKGESESRITNLLKLVDGGGLHAEDQLKNRSG